MVIGSEWLLVLAPLIAVVLAFLRQSGWRWERLFYVAVFSVYGLVAVGVTLFPIPVEHFLSPQLAEVPFSNWFELRPFTISFQPTIIRTQTFPNIVLGIPFGFGAWFVLSKPGWRRVAALGVLAALAIELGQLAVSLVLVGFPYRVTDISDFIFNYAGVVLGIGFYFAFAAVWRALDDGTSTSGVIGHIRAVVS